MEKTDPLTPEKESMCGCSQESQKEGGSTVKKDLPEQQEEEQPTRYGDWVKKGRCIDF